MTNKYIWIGIAAAAVIAGGLIYRNFFLPESRKPQTGGKTAEIKMRIVKNEWRFEPENVEVNRGDKVILRVFNEDDFDHGIAIDAFGVNQRIPPLSEITVEFVATQVGDFPFYCSVPCGEGVVDGKARGHLDQRGKIFIKEITDVRY